MNSDQEHPLVEAYRQLVSEVEQRPSAQDYVERCFPENQALVRGMIDADLTLSEAVVVLGNYKGILPDAYVKKRTDE